MIFDVNSVDDLAGDASIGTITVAIGGGVSMGKICLGKGCSEGIGPALGVDISVDTFTGTGDVKNKKKKCCD